MFIGKIKGCFPFFLVDTLQTEILCKAKTNRKTEAQKRRFFLPYLKRNTIMNFVIFNNRISRDPSSIHIQYVVQNLKNKPLGKSKGLIHWSKLI